MGRRRKARDAIKIESFRIQTSSKSRSSETRRKCDTLVGTKESVGNIVAARLRFERAAGNATKKARRSESSARGQATSSRYVPSTLEDLQSRYATRERKSRAKEESLQPRKKSTETELCQ